MKKTILTLTVLFLSVSFALGQTTREEVYSDIGVTSGMCYPYSYTPEEPTPVPKGYKPVYISHFSRHGSRYHTWDALYSSCYEMLAQADSLGILTSEGQRLLPKLKDIADDAYMRTGDLSQRGLDEQRGIARRMYESFRPLLGRRGVEIRAYSTKVHRTILSMTAFVEELSKCNQQAHFNITASLREQQHLNHAPNAAELRPEFESLFREAPYDNPPYRLVSQLISDEDFIQGNPEWCYGFFDRLIQIALVLPAQCSPYDLRSLFTDDELFNYWKKDNYRLYLEAGPSREFGRAVSADAIPLLENIIETADEALSMGYPQATLRFGHDLNFVPLVSLLDVNGLGQVQASSPDELWQRWSSFKVSPMSTNLQFIFYRNKEGRVIVKLLFNEHEASLPLESLSGPYYDWTLVKEYLHHRCADLAL